MATCRLWVATGRFRKSWISGDRSKLLADLVFGLDNGASDRPFQTLAEIELEHIWKVLDHVSGYRAEAAKILGSGARPFIAG